MLYASVYFFVLSSIDPLTVTISCHVRLLHAFCLLDIISYLCRFACGCKLSDIFLVLEQYLLKCGGYSIFFVTLQLKEKSPE